ncbi:MAG: hypothetical protein Q9192_008516, partial [Flavoplaca navasiana]
VQMFLTLLNDPTELFDRSIPQGLLLYDGAILQIYGVLWLWVLVRKMKRLQMENQPQREVDWIDCVSITKRLTEENGVSVPRAALTEFDHEPPVFPATVDAVNYRFRLLYGFDGFMN